MKIKTKLTLGVGLLFILIILLSLVGAFNINALKSDTENILRANYNSLLYSGTTAVLNNPSINHLNKLNSILDSKEKNATEIGENEANLELRKNIEAYQNKTSDSHAQLAIQQSLYQIMNLNMQAIQRKSEIANATAHKAVLWIAITGSLCFIIAFTLLINLPATRSPTQ